MFLPTQPQSFIFNRSIFSFFSFCVFQTFSWTSTQYFPSLVRIFGVQHKSSKSHHVVEDEARVRQFEVFDQTVELPAVERTPGTVQVVSGLRLLPSVVVVLELNKRNTDGGFETRDKKKQQKQKQKTVLYWPEQRRRLRWWKMKSNVTETECFLFILVTDYGWNNVNMLICSFPAQVVRLFLWIKTYKTKPVDFH